MSINSLLPAGFIRNISLFLIYKKPNVLHLFIVQYLHSYTTPPHSVLFELWDPNSNYSMKWSYPSHPLFFSFVPLFIFLCPFWDEWDRDHVKYLRDRFIMQNSNLISSIACSFQNHQASASVFFMLVLPVPEPNKAYAHSEMYFPWMFLCIYGYLT